MTSGGDPLVELALVAPTGPATLEEWFAPLSAADKAAWPEEPGWLFHERIALLHQPGLRSHVLGVARVGSAIAGCFQVRMPLKENLDSADLEVWVDPVWRRRGVGRLLLSVAEDAARAHGRTSLSGTSEAPLGSPERPRQERFARAAGYEPAFEEARRALDLPVDAGRLDALDEEASELSSGYRLVGWTGPCPAEWEAARLEFARAMSTDAPHGEVELEPEQWDVERLRHFEQVTEAMDRDTLATAAVAPTGRLAGFTEIGIPRQARSVAYQFDTIVLHPHRGHRLGLRMKVANVRRLQEQSPMTRRVVTSNATSNGPMVRVNERLGFHLVGTGTVWQKRIG